MASFFIVDDDVIMIQAMTIMLEGRGHSVASNASSAEAIEQITASPPDCLITDLMMANVDGLELIGELRSRPGCRSMKVIMVTSKNKDLWRRKAAAAGVDGYIVKPLDTDTFADQVEAALAGRSTI